MKARLAFHPYRFRTPHVYSRYAEKPTQGYDEIKVMDLSDWTGKQWNTWIPKFPCCSSCLEGSRRKRIFKAKARAVNVLNVMTKKYGKFLGAKKTPCGIFEFRNDEFGEFSQANEGILLDKVLSELGAEEA